MDLQSLVLKLLNKKEAVEEYNKLKSWRDETAENLKLYQEMNTLINEGQNLSSHKQFDVEKGYQNFLDKRENTSSSSWWKYAAVIALLIVAFFVYNQFGSTSEVQAKTYIAENQVESFDLMDGSNITLNQQSTLDIVSDFQDTRNVKLQGEAFFDIAKDESRPFRIDLGQENYVEVLGTSFDIINTDDNLEVIVFSGKVSFHTLDRDIILTKGQAVKRIDGAYTKYKHNENNKLSWINNELVFNNVPVANVLSDISNHYNIDIDVSSEVQKSNCKLSTKFKTESLQSILEELKKVIRLEYTVSSEGKYSFNSIECE